MNSTLMFKVTFSTVTALFFTISKFEIIYLFYTIKNEIITSLKMSHCPVLDKMETKSYVQFIFFNHTLSFIHGTFDFLYYYEKIELAF